MATKHNVNPIARIGQTLKAEILRGWAFSPAPPSAAPPPRSAARPAGSKGVRP